METSRLRRQVRSLIFLQAVTFLVVVLLASRQPDQFFETQTVYSVGQVGPQGPAGRGLQGLPGLTTIGPQGPPGNSIQGPPGKDAQPCTTTQGENGDTLISCPDGSSTVIPKPKDGEDGQDGKTVEFRTNPSSCDIEYRYSGERIWITLVEKECDDGSIN